MLLCLSVGLFQLIRIHPCGGMIIMSEGGFQLFVLGRGE